MNTQKSAVQNTVGAIHELPLLFWDENHYVTFFQYIPENQRDYQ